MTDEHMNLQAKSNKIFGVVKQGANRTDVNAIRKLQIQGMNEHEIQSDTGVCFSTVRSFMGLNDPDFVETEVSPTPDTQHLHDRIAELESQVEDQNADDPEDEDEDED